MTKIKKNQIVTELKSQIVTVVVVTVVTVAVVTVFIVSFGAKISHKKFQHDSSNPSLSKFAIQFTMGISI